jgi:hypothetical protein
MSWTVIAHHLSACKVQIGDFRASSASPNVQGGAAIERRRGGTASRSQAGHGVRAGPPLGKGRPGQNDGDQDRNTEETANLGGFAAR